MRARLLWLGARRRRYPALVMNVLSSHSIARPSIRPGVRMLTAWDLGVSLLAHIRPEAFDCSGAPLWVLREPPTVVTHRDCHPRRTTGHTQNSVAVDQCVEVSHSVQDGNDGGFVTDASGDVVDPAGDGRDPDREHDDVVGPAGGRLSAQDNGASEGGRKLVG